MILLILEKCENNESKIHVIEKNWKGMVNLYKLSVNNEKQIFDSLKKVLMILLANIDNIRALWK